jgi:hypothetical protein
MRLSDLYKNMPASVPNEDPKDRIQKKHNEYYAAARRYQLLYYTTRLVAGLCAGILPFVISTAPAVAISLSIAIVVATVIDTIFGPRERWRSLSRATDLLYVTDLKKQGKYEEFAESLKIILTTEDQQMLELLGLNDVIRKAKESAERALTHRSPQKAEATDQPPVGARESAKSKRDSRIQEALGLDPPKKSDPKEK